jgi:hypothetical protein
MLISNLQPYLHNAHLLSACKGKDLKLYTKGMKYINQTQTFTPELQIIELKRVHTYL